LADVGCGAKGGHEMDACGPSPIRPPLPPRADGFDAARLPGSATLRPEHLQQSACYSITSPARTRREGGISEPRALVVLALITNVKNRGYSNGRSAGFDALRMRSTR